MVTDEDKANDDTQRWVGLCMVPNTYHVWTITNGYVEVHVEGYVEGHVEVHVGSKVHFSLSLS